MVLAGVLALGTVTVGSPSAGASQFDAIVTMTPLTPYGRLGSSLTPGTPMTLSGANSPSGAVGVPTPTVRGLVMLATSEPLRLGWRNPLDRQATKSVSGSAPLLVDTTLLPNGLNVIELDPGPGGQARWFNVDNPTSNQLQLTSPSGVRAAHDATWRADETLTFSSGETFESVQVSATNFKYPQGRNIFLETPCSTSTVVSQPMNAPCGFFVGAPYQLAGQTRVAVTVTAKSVWVRSTSTVGLTWLLDALPIRLLAENKFDYFPVTYQPIELGRTGYATVGPPAMLDSTVVLTGKVILRASVDPRISQFSVQELNVDWNTAWRYPAGKDGPMWESHRDSGVGQGYTDYVLDTSLLPDGQHEIEVRGKDIANISGSPKFFTTNNKSFTKLQFVDVLGATLPAGKGGWKPSDSMTIAPALKANYSAEPLTWNAARGFWESSGQDTLNCLPATAMKKFLVSLATPCVDRPVAVGSGEAVAVLVEPPAISVFDSNTGMTTTHNGFKFTYMAYDPNRACVASGC
jgi:hypothetical protein